MKTLLARACRLGACLLAGFSLPALAELPSLSHQVAGGDRDYIVQPGDFLIAIGARFGLAADPAGAGQRRSLRSADPPRPALPHPQPPHRAGRCSTTASSSTSRSACCSTSAGARCWPPIPSASASPPGPRRKANSGSSRGKRTRPGKCPCPSRRKCAARTRSCWRKCRPAPTIRSAPTGSDWSLWGYGIHGTIAPSSVYHFRSHGCIRLHPDDIAELFDRVSVGTPGRLIYQPVLLAVVDDGRILLEVHRDIYELGHRPGADRSRHGRGP